MRIFGQASSFEEGINSFKEHIQAVTKLIGERAESNETSIITMFLQRVSEERKLYQSGKEPCHCEIVIKPNEVEYRYSNLVLGWTVFDDGIYEFFFQKNKEAER